MEKGAAVRRGRPPVAVVLTAEERAELLRRVNAATTPQRDVLRAKVILAAAEGESTAWVATRLKISVDAVSTWRGRFARRRLEGLRDRARSGRRAVITPVQRCEIVAVACEPRPAQDGLHGWTLDLLRQEIEQREIVRISRSHLHTILQRADLKPHRKRMWLHSPDPNFREKVTEVVELYVNPPPGHTVLCIDEKTGMQAIERKHPDRPPQPGQMARREFEYIRHGTQALLAAFDVRTGHVVQRCGPTRTGDDLEAFMEEIARTVSGPIDVIWDNLNIHHGERWERFNQKHGDRFRFHYTPLHASWVNQIELWFGILQRRCLENGSFKSVEELRAAVAAFVAYWNGKAKHPFRWSFTGYRTQPALREGKPCAQAI